MQLANDAPLLSVVLYSGVSFVQASASLVQTTSSLTLVCTKGVLVSHQPCNIPSSITQQLPIPTLRPTQAPAWRRSGWRWRILFSISINIINIIADIGAYNSHGSRQFICSRLHIGLGVYEATPPWAKMWPQVRCCAHMYMHTYCGGFVLIRTRHLSHFQGHPDWRYGSIPAR